MSEEIITLLGSWLGPSGEPTKGELRVVCIDGVVMDVSPSGQLLEQYALHLDDDGHVRGWGGRISFRPDDGEAAKFPGTGLKHLARIDKLPRF